ncbi:protein of unknown function [Candidatus Hydrogenisulfobacillus filiaventi]|uniref:Uncharacterized protein n=1 Tax=Candidatus Hydrogenisulfobacillus filiaventi TaxID=2707344 RepID=A0A6F8ZK43_9FIRM|nr:protein of unknown function [Candidatus Hydrogenisulfobacillus filiaventi]
MPVGRPLVLWGSTLWIGLLGNSQTPRPPSPGFCSSMC